MNEPNVFFQWKNPAIARGFQTGVSLHSHTLHSRECLTFVSRTTKNVPYLSAAIRKHEAKYKEEHNGRALDFARAWWTPPLSAQQAWNLEREQAENNLGLNALVSLTDHDNIEAGVRLSLSHREQAIPISMEWTVPFRQTFFHLGVHNIPPYEAQDWAQSMAAFTREPEERELRGLLARWHERPEVLIVFNHPMWDEKRVGSGLHWSLVTKFLKLYREFVDALELNGLRPWRENRQTITLAQTVGKPVISGGDRHGREPNACINLTNAATFPAFVEEVRGDRWSQVLFLPQYREALRFRIIQNLCEILRPDTEHSMAWVQWMDRVFYLCDDGVVRSLTELWFGKCPAFITQFVRLVGLARERWVESALRFALAEKNEPAL